MFWFQNAPKYRVSPHCASKKEDIPRSKRSNKTRASLKGGTSSTSVHHFWPFCLGFGSFLVTLANTKNKTIPNIPTIFFISSFIFSAWSNWARLTIFMTHHLKLLFEILSLQLEKLCCYFNALQLFINSSTSCWKLLLKKKEEEKNYFIFNSSWPFFSFLFVPKLLRAFKGRPYCFLPCSQGQPAAVNCKWTRAHNWPLSLFFLSQETEIGSINPSSGPICKRP